MYVRRYNKITISNVVADDVTCIEVKVPFLSIVGCCIGFNSPLRQYFSLYLAKEKVERN